MSRHLVITFNYIKNNLVNSKTRLLFEVLLMFQCIYATLKKYLLISSNDIDNELIIFIISLFEK